VASFVPLLDPANRGKITPRPIAVPISTLYLSYFSKEFKEKYGVSPSEYGTKVQ
jgi:hypothetical protein